MCVTTARKEWAWRAASPGPNDGSRLTTRTFNESACLRQPTLCLNSTVPLRMLQNEQYTASVMPFFVPFFHAGPRSYGRVAKRRWGAYDAAYTGCAVRNPTENNAT